MSNKGVANLRPFKAGEADPRRYTPQKGRGNHSKINDPEFLQLFAEKAVEGLTNQQLADAFGVGRRTISNWRKDARVKNAQVKLINERIVRITARTDASLDRLLDSDEFKQLPVDERITIMLKVRKEYLGGILRSQAEAGKLDSETINKAFTELESKPEFARELEELLERAES